MALKIQQLDYRLSLIKKCDQEDVDFRQQTLLLQQFLYYEKPLDVPKEWNYNNATAFLTKDELQDKNKSHNLRKGLFVNFFRERKYKTNLITLKFTEWDKVLDFIKDFQIKPEQILLAAWLYTYKSVFLTFYVDKECSDEWFTICENSLHLFNCLRISKYGEIFCKKSASIPSHISDRYLDPETLIVTDDLSYVISHAKNAFENPLKLDDFQSKIKENFDEAKKYYETVIFNANQLPDNSEFNSSNKMTQLLSHCRDPRCVYSTTFDNEERLEWLEGIKGILSIIVAKIMYFSKQTNLISLSLNELYCYCRSFSFFGMLNVKSLREMILKSLKQEHLISNWDSTKEEMDISKKIEKTENIEQLF